VALGKLLFWDPILSGNGDVACATCHHANYGYAENLDISIGVNGIGLGSARRLGSSSQAIPLVRRNSQTLLNSAFNGIDQQGHYNPSTAPMFWDIRAQSLEAQALVPIKTLEEMRGTSYSEEQALDAVTVRLKAILEYRTLFATAFGGKQPIEGSTLYIGVEPSNVHYGTEPSTVHYGTEPSTLLYGYRTSGWPVIPSYR
jgi:cytochrome c peroxidase